jgi:GNAT superfamily N-acetyltransferase
MSRSERQCSIQIRLATADEAASIAWVLHQAFAEYASLYTPAAFSLTTPTPDEIKQRWKEGPVWSALKNGCLIGTAAAVAKGDALYIRSMAVVSSARGQGVGKILLAEVERFAKAGGFQRMVLSTTPFLNDAIRLYERFGFERIPDGPHDLAGTPLFTMKKELKC